MASEVAAGLEIVFHSFLGRTSKNHQYHKKFQQYPFFSPLKSVVNEKKISIDGEFYIIS
jgi:hypothetical protein